MESLPVPSVQAMVAATGGAEVPSRYHRPEASQDPVANDIEAEIPVIDFQRLLDPDACPEDSARLHRACQDWGFFQLINHGVPSDVIKGMKASIEGFFQLPPETKKKVAQERGQLDGYGHLFVVSEDQKLDWSDVLYLNTRPPYRKNLRFWPDKPDNFRLTLEKYSAATMNIVERLLPIIAKNLELQPEALTDKFIGGIQSIRMNYYPACAKAENVVGLAPHSDAGFLTLVLQVNQVQGLQIRRNGTWVPVKPLDSAFVVNLGDTFEIFTNGRYKSIEHRAVVNTEKERLSIAAFHGPNMHAKIGPLKEIVAHEVEAYKTVDHENFRRLFLSGKLVGKSFLEQMKL
ncbi:hypothetical protein EJB05_22916 [Eragrostis curvula]|uniref:Fe2OG dioxygenase domain-containing protein n=1 Tax=Eragrostis curvula TaxID=38414 RepID=A0A5J9V5N5_9POAL|nr:hypothetical protein EJB05_22916 [Eragrostis curvula]